MSKQYWEEFEVAGIELLAMRMMRKKTLYGMVKLSKKYKGVLISPMGKSDFEYYEKRKGGCPRDVSEFYMRSLGITRSHMAQFKKILKGELKTFEEGRTVSQSVKKEVKKKHKNKCALCGFDENLQMHHKEPFSKGGQNTIENLILLCASCHAKQHEGEKVHNLIKSKSKNKRVIE